MKRASIHACLLVKERGGQITLDAAHTRTVHIDSWAGFAWHALAPESRVSLFEATIGAWRPDDRRDAMPPII